MKKLSTKQIKELEDITQDICSYVAGQNYNRLAGDTVITSDTRLVRSALKLKSLATSSIKKDALAGAFDNLESSLHGAVLSTASSPLPTPGIDLHVSDVASTQEALGKFVERLDRLRDALALYGTPSKKDAAQSSEQTEAGNIRSSNERVIKIFARVMSLAFLTVAIWSGVRIVRYFLLSV